MSGWHGSTLSRLPLALISSLALAGCLNTMPPIHKSDVEDIDISGTYRVISSEKGSDGLVYDENLRISRVDVGLFTAFGPDICGYLYTLQMPGTGWLILAWACDDPNQGEYGSYYLADWTADGFVVRTPSADFSDIYAASADRFGISFSGFGGGMSAPSALAIRTLLADGFLRSYLRFDRGHLTFSRVPDDPSIRPSEPILPPPVLPSSEGGATGIFAFESLAQPLTDPEAEAPLPAPSRP